MTGNGEYVTGKDLQNDQTIFNGFSIIGAKLLKLIMATENPKANFYSGSKSTSSRVAAAVAQKKHWSSNTA